MDDQRERERLEAASLELGAAFGRRSRHARGDAVGEVDRGLLDLLALGEHARARECPVCSFEALLREAPTTVLLLERGADAVLQCE